MTRLSLGLITCLDYLGNLRYVVVKVASTENDQHVKVAALHEVEYFVLTYDAFFNAWFEVVVYQFRRYTFDRKFTCRINLCEYDFIELAQRIGEIAIEIACTRIKMWLEDSRDLAVKACRRTQRRFGM